MNRPVLSLVKLKCCVVAVLAAILCLLFSANSYAQVNYQNLFNQTTDIDTWTKSVATPGITISSTSPLDGARSLRSSLIAGSSQVSYITKEMVTLTGPQFDTEGMDWEWSFVYRNNMGANPDNERPSNDVNLLENNKNSWRLWLFTNQDNVEDNNVKGYYVTQDNSGRIVLRFRNSQWDTRDMILSGALTNGSSYVIRISRVLYQGNTIYRLYVDPFNQTQQTATTYIGQAYLADAPRTYNKTALVSVNKTTNDGAFSWDNMNMFKRSIVLVDANSPANGITPGPLSYGMNNIVLFGWGVTVQGTVNIQDMNIVHPGNTNPHGYFGSAAGDARIYRSTDAVYSVDDVQVGSAKFSGTDVQITGLNEEWNHLAGSTLYYFLVADFKETWGNTSNPLQFKFVPNQTPSQIIQNTPQYWKYNDGTLNGTSFTISKTYVWTGTASPDPTDWNNPANWDFASTVPGPEDHALIGKNTYAQPVIYSGNAEVGKLTADNLRNTTITVNSGASLKVNSDITQRNSATTDLTLTLAGAGSITTGALTAGNMTTPTFSGTRTTKIISTISSLNVTGDVTLNSIANGTPKNNATVEIQTGTTTIGSVKTVNGTGTTSTLTTATGSQNAQLNIKGAGPFNLSATATNTINFNGTSAIVNYNGTVEQVVHPTTYRTLEVNNTAGATLSSASTINKLIIGIDTANAVFTSTANQTNTLVEMYQNARYVTSAPTFTALNTNSVLNSGTTIEFNSSSAQTVNASAENFQNVTVSGSGTKSFTASSSRALVIDGAYTVDGPVAYLTNISSIDMNGNFEGASSITSASKPITIAGSWNNTATGAIAGAVTYDGASAQAAAAHVTYGGALNLTGAGTKTWYSTIPNSLVTVSGATNVSAPVAIGTNVIGVDLNGNLTGNVLPSFGSVPLTLAGSWTNTATGTLAGSVNYDGTTTQTVAGAVTYNDLTFSQSGNKTVTRSSAGAFTVNGDLSYLHSGTTSYTNVNAIDINGDFLGTAVLTSGGSIPITIAGNWNNTATGTISGAVTYDGSSDQNLSAKVTYTTLNLTGSGTKNLYSNTAGGTLTVNGATNISAPVGTGTNVTAIDFNGNVTGNVLPSFGSIPMTVSGSWTNTATGTVTSPVTYDGSSTQTASAGVTYTNVSFTGIGNKTISRSTSGAFTVDGDLTYNQSGSTTYTNVNAIDINGDFLGSTSISSGSTPITIAGDWNNTATGTIAGSVTYDGSSAQNLSAKVTYTTLNLTGSGTKNLYSNTAGGTLTVNGSTNVSAPVAAGSNVTSIDFNGNLTGNTLPSFGSVPINISGNWTNTATGTIAGSVTYDHATNAQSVSGWVDYSSLSLTGAGTKTVTNSGLDNLFVSGAYTVSSPVAYSNVSLIEVGDVNGTQFINSGNIPVTVNGNWNSTAAGTVTGLVRYAGSGNQVVGGVTYADLNVENGGTKTASPNVQITGLLTLTGNAILNSSGNVTLVQTASTMASIGEIPAGANVTGNVNIQIYITGGTLAHRGTRMMSSPINDAALVNKTYKQLQSYMFITGIQGGTGFDAGGTYDPYAKTIRLYNEPAPPTPAAGNFTDISDINTASPPGQGFFLFFRGNRTNPTGKLNEPVVAPETVVVTFTGPINKGTLVKNLSYTNNNDSKDGLNVLGNPYPSILDWHRITKTANVGSTIQVIRRGTFGYATYDAVTGTSVNGGSRYLQPAQGFYVQASAAGQSITFNESNKVNTAPAERLLSTPLNDQVLGGGLLRNDGLMDTPPQQAESSNYTIPAFQRITLNIEGSQGNEETAIVFKEGNSADAKLEDGSYTAGAVVALSSLSANNVQMAINMMPPVQQVQNVLLRVSSTVSGAMKLNFTELKDLENYKITLLDKYLNTQTLVTAGSVYNFTIDRNIAATFGATRFELVFEAPAISLSSFTAEQVEKTSKLDWTTASETQSVRYDVERSTDGTSFTKIGEVNGAGTSTQASNYSFVDQNPVYGTNYYRFKNYDANGRVFTSVTLQLTFTPPPAMVLNTFTAEKAGATAQLKWTTGSEYRSARFEVERSADGTTFSKIGEVAGSGTTSQAVNYAFTDQTPLTGVNHYRLKHINLSNETLTSNVLQLTFNPPAITVIASFTGQKAGTMSKLDWTTSSEYESLRFEIERSTDGATFSKIGEVKASGSSNDAVSYTYTDQAPVYGTNYYRLKNISTTNQVLLSQVVQIIHEAETPSMVLASFKGEKEGVKAKLTWVTSSEYQSARFEIERSIDGLNFMVIGEVAGAGTTQQSRSYTFTDDEPVNGLNYYRIKNYDTNEHTLLSSTVQLTFEMPGATFAGFTAEKENTASRLNWSTSNEYRSRNFEVQHSADGVTFTAIGNVNGSGTSTNTEQYSFLHTTPRIGANYYRIKHYTTDNQTLTSVVVQLNFDALPAMVLSNFTGERNGAFSKLTWVTASEYQNARFEIERSADGAAYTKIGSVNGAGTSYDPKAYTYTDENPLPGLNYYRLKQYSTIGQSTVSDAVQISFQVNMPVTIVSFAGTKQEFTSLLYWSTSSESASLRFDVERSTDGLNFTAIGSVNGAGNSTQIKNYTFTDTRPAYTTNYYRLKHYNTSNQVTFSNVIQLRFDPPAAMVLTNFTGIKLNGTSQLSWNTLSEYQSDKFDVERSTDGQNYTLLGSVRGSGTSNQPHSYTYTDILPKFGKNYYRLKHHDTSGKTLLSSEVIIDFDVPGSQAVPFAEVKVFPNPVVDIVNVNFNNAEHNGLVVSVYDVQSGKKYSSTNYAATDTISQDVSELRTGIYMIEIKDVSTNKLLAREKFIKQ